MIRLSTSAVAAVIAGLAAGPAAAEATRYDARLAGHALVPAATFLVPPEDAPRALMLSGRFAGPDNERNEQIGTVEGRTWIGPDGMRRGTNMFLPFAGQPVQGFSGIRAAGDGSIWATQDNGFGSKVNSADAMLIAHRVRPEFDRNRIVFLDTLFLSDPQRVIPFPITNDFTRTRYLTGADFDIESIQPVGDLLWFGDEFGPYLIATDRAGRVVHLAETMLDGAVLRSPDHPAVRTPATPGEVGFSVRRSRGFEGMAAAPDGSRLYPLLEGQLRDPETGAPEEVDGEPVLRLLEFDPAAREWTGRNWTYGLESPDHAIGDFNMISETRGLVIERDGGEGVPANACPEGEARFDCFPQPARFKRVYLIELPEAGEGEAVDKLAYVDLMDIADPDGVAITGETAGEGGTFHFPFVTIESVDRVDERHIVVGNDNNLPFSTGREIGTADHNEWILLEVADFLDHGAGN